MHERENDEQKAVKRRRHRDAEGQRRWVEEETQEEGDVCSSFSPRRGRREGERCVLMRPSEAQCQTRGADPVRRPLLPSAQEDEQEEEEDEEDEAPSGLPLSLMVLLCQQ